MATARSIALGAAYAGAGVALGYVWGSGWNEIADMGSVQYLNDFARFFGSAGALLGYAGGIGAGIYEAFFSPDAQQQPQAPQAPQQPGRTYNVNIRGRDQDIHLR